MYLIIRNYLLSQDHNFIFIVFINKGQLIDNQWQV